MPLVPTRRHFLHTAALALASRVRADEPASAPSAPAPNSRLHHACIGVGGMGRGDLQSILNDPRAQIVALCDIDARRLEEARKLVPDARVYRDYRELLAQEGDRIDSVNVSVPDHSHAAIAIPAMRAGKHVYCQKPLAHEVAEVRAMVDTARAKGVVTQLGTQHASGVGDRLAVEWIRSGVIGKVSKVYTGSNRPGSDAYRLPGPRPAKEDAVPDHVLWDLWLGTAPSRPYVHGVYHPFAWRTWIDFGTGWSGDIGCHVLDAVFKALDLAAPKRLRSTVQKSWAASPARRAEVWPQGNRIEWIFAGTERTAGPELSVEWFDGEFFPPTELTRLYPGTTFPGEFALFQGEGGWLLLPHGSGPMLLPRERFSGVAKPAIPPRNHYSHFISGCLGAEKNESRFERVSAMAETVLLGTIAHRVPGEWLEWDSAQLRFPQSPAAQALVRRVYREGWAVEGLG
jgi:predicted dehydrogenase